MNPREGKTSLRRLGAIGGVGQSHGRAQGCSTQQTIDQPRENHQGQADLIPVDAHEDKGSQEKQRVKEGEDHDNFAAVLVAQGCIVCDGKHA